MQLTVAEHPPQPEPLFPLSHRTRNVVMAFGLSEVTMSPDLESQMAEASLILTAN